MIFLDAASGTKPYSETVQIITDVLQNHWGNASADYSFGHDARLIIDKITNTVASDINCDPEEVIWTSGACEANSFAITGVMNANSNTILCSSKLEHASSYEAFKNSPYVTYMLENDNIGKIKIDALESVYKEIRDRWGCIPFISVSFANSEIGVIQDVKLIAKITHKYNGIVHVDATQMFPLYKINVKEFGIDLMSVSGQKMHGPKGIGFLYINKNIKIDPIIYGNQQKGLRGGSYPTHLIAAFGKALELTRKHNATEYVSMLRNKLIYKLLCINGVHLNGPSIGNNRLPNNISLIIDDVDASALVTMCDLMGVIIAKGSACKSYEPTPSESLLAIGLTPEQALNTVRITLDEFNTVKEIDTAANIITQLVERIRQDG